MLLTASCSLQTNTMMDDKWWIKFSATSSLQICFTLLPLAFVWKEAIWKLLNWDKSLLMLSSEISHFSFENFKALFFELHFSVHGSMIATDRPVGSMLALPRRNEATGLYFHLENYLTEWQLKMESVWEKRAFLRSDKV